MALKDLISKNDPDISKDDRDVLAASAVERRQAAQERCDALDMKAASLLQEQAALEVEIGKTTDDDAAKKLAAHIKEIETERIINRERQKAAGADRRQAEIDLHKVRAADKLKVARRHTNVRVKAAQKMADGISLLYEGWSEMDQTREKLTLWGGYDLTVNHGGSMLSRSETRAAVEQELMRVSAPPPLDDKAVPALPGVPPALFSGDPTKLPKLTDVVAQANEHLVRRIEAGPIAPAPAPRPEPQHSEPAPIVPDATPRPSGPTMGAEQIMAGIAPRKLGG